MEAIARASHLTGAEFSDVKSNVLHQEATERQAIEMTTAYTAQQDSLSADITSLRHEIHVLSEQVALDGQRAKLLEAVDAYRGALLRRET